MTRDQIQKLKAKTTLYYVGDDNVVYKGKLNKRASFAYGYAPRGDEEAWECVAIDTTTCGFKLVPPEYVFLTFGGAKAKNIAEFKARLAKAESQRAAKTE